MELASIAPSERNGVDYVADLYSTLITLEKLEKAKLRDLVTEEQYTASLKKVLQKYDQITAQLTSAAVAASSGSYGSSGPTVAEHIGLVLVRGGGIEEFMKKFNFSCPAALNRLLKGTKDTDGSFGSNSSPLTEGPSSIPAIDPKTVLEVGQHFITLMDCVKLQQTAVDQLHPILTDLLNCLTRVSGEMDFVPKLQRWMDQLNSMHASDQLGERDTREMAFDLDRSYQSFHRFLQGLTQSRK